MDLECLYSLGPGWGRARVTPEAGEPCVEAGGQDTLCAASEGHQEVLGDLLDLLHQLCCVHPTIQVISDVYPPSSQTLSAQTRTYEVARCRIPFSWSHRAPWS